MWFFKIFFSSKTKQLSNISMLYSSKFVGNDWKRVYFFFKESFNWERFYTTGVSKYRAVLRPPLKAAISLLF